jgi:hypothetical protein
MLRFTSTSLLIAALAAPALLQQPPGPLPTEQARVEGDWADGYMYRLCYIRGPEGILIGLAQQLEQQTPRADPIGGLHDTSR